MSNLKRYVMVIRRDERGFATIAAKHSQHIGEWVKVAELIKLLQEPLDKAEGISQELAKHRDEFKE